MDLDENLARKAGDPMIALARMDLDPLSVEECEVRIAALEDEIARTKKRMTHAVNHRATAASLFKR